MVTVSMKVDEIDAAIFALEEQIRNLRKKWNCDRGMCRGRGGLVAAHRPEDTLPGMKSLKSLRAKLKQARKSR